VAFATLWPPYKGKLEFAGENIEKHGRLLLEEVTLAHISRAQDEWTAARKHYDAETEARDYQYFGIIERHVDPKLYDKRLDELHLSICEGTGSWLLRDDLFKNWLDPTENSVDLIWLQGLPGAGKTYVTSRVVDHAREKGNSLFAFLRYDETVSALSVLHSLIFQLVSLDANLRTVLCTDFRSSSRDLKRDLKGSTKFAADTLLVLLQCASAPTYIIVDGLDEVDEYARQLILLQLLDTKSKAGEHGVIKLFISSRREENIERHLKVAANIIRLDQRNAGCIQKYVTRETQAWLDRSGFDAQACYEIKRMLMLLPVDVEGKDV